LQLRWAAIGCGGQQLVAVGSNWLRWAAIGCAGQQMVAVGSNWLRWAAIGCAGQQLVAVGSNWSDRNWLQSVAMQKNQHTKLLYF
jgi:hypothetical protein